MIDINNILTQALNAAVQEATKPLLERIETLQTHCNAYEVLFKETRERIAALEVKLTEADLFTKMTPGTLEQRISVLEQSSVLDKARLDGLAPAAITADAFVTHLDNQEWFWEKLTSKAAEIARAAVEDCSVTEARVESLIEDAISNHCSDYDHDDYDSAASTVNNYDFDDFITQDSVEEAVNEALGNASFEVRVSR